MATHRWVAALLLCCVVAAAFAADVSNEAAAAAAEKEDEDLMDGQMPSDDGTVASEQPQGEKKGEQAPVGSESENDQGAFKSATVDAAEVTADTPSHKDDVEEDLLDGTVPKEAAKSKAGLQDGFPSDHQLDLTETVSQAKSRDPLSPSNPGSILTGTPEAGKGFEKETVEVWGTASAFAKGDGARGIDDYENQQDAKNNNNNRVRPPAMAKPTYDAAPSPDALEWKVNHGVDLVIQRNSEAVDIPKKKSFEQWAGEEGGDWKRVEENEYMDGDKNKPGGSTGGAPPELSDQQAYDLMLPAPRPVNSIGYKHLFRGPMDNTPDAEAKVEKDELGRIVSGVQVDRFGRVMRAGGQKDMFGRVVSQGGAPAPPTAELDEPVKFDQEGLGDPWSQPSVRPAVEEK